MSEHAKVPTGEYMVPLIGVPPTAVEETCEVCKNDKVHIKDIVIVDGVFMCPKCAAKK